MIVDDTAYVGRALSRALSKRFDEVHALTTAAEASALLGRTPVTHVICDHCLADGDPPGLELVPRWRRENTSIVRAIVLTGMDETALRRAPEIDAILSKLATTEEIARTLGLPNEVAARKTCSRAGQKLKEMLANSETP